ncbi:hypothetical protein T233_01005 [Vagococcus lutrae LBD1]|uniref:Uncharacterized protein n=1 Tax=Vagococcus lutrae LBD1 TaxID=1408226 RepID=V6Q445_9ENTE|nr:hypothetical protein [Vagococcus lutrae]EST89899.1 hypothetical protein T233_01005 [Vagococcus lutrae LBD1]
MEGYEQEDIQALMMIDKTIESLELRKKQKLYEWYQRTFATHVVYSDEGVRTAGIRPEQFMLEINEIERSIDKRIKICEIKDKYWKQFLETLESHERAYFFKKYKYGKKITNPRLDQLAYEELEEIEQAIEFHFTDKKVQAKKPIIIQGNFKQNMANILNVLESR